MSYNIVHIFPKEKFLNEYVIEINKMYKNHLFVVYGSGNYQIPKVNNLIVISNTNRDKKLIEYLKKSDKIIFHSGFFDIKRMIYLRFSHRELFYKSGIIFWGNDLSKLTEKEKSLKQVIKKKILLYIYKSFKYKYTVCYQDNILVNKLIDVNEYNLALYSSGYYKYYELIDSLISDTENKKKKILISHSGDESLNHKFILRKIKESQIESYIYCLLSYGNVEYINDVIKYGRDLFNEKFIPICEFVDFAEYIKLLSGIDVLVIYSDRQIALGCIYLMILLQKDIYVKENSPLYYILKNELKININCNATKLQRKTNAENIKKLLSEENFFKLWEKIFYESK